MPVLVTLPTHAANSGSSYYCYFNHFNPLGRTCTPLVLSGCTEVKATAAYIIPVLRFSARNGLFCGSDPRSSIAAWSLLQGESLGSKLLTSLGVLVNWEGRKVHLYPPPLCDERNLKRQGFCHIRFHFVVYKPLPACTACNQTNLGLSRCFGGQRRDMGFNRCQCPWCSLYPNPADWTVKKQQNEA